MEKATRKDIGEKYLGIKQDYSPTHKDMSDNLRAYLTVVAYSFAIRFIWLHEQKDPIGTFVFRFVAVLWAIWLLWFFILTLVQTFGIAAGFIGDLLGFLFSGVAARDERANTRMARLRLKTFHAAAYVSAVTCMIFFFGTFYIVGALVEMAQLK
jgi:hypothetical protein